MITADRAVPACRSPGRPKLSSGNALDKERLVETLLRLARNEGVSALNMRRVASELSVSTRLLYHFVRDKEDMLSLLGDTILERNTVDLSDPDWRVRLRSIAHMVRRAFAGYPGLPSAVLSRSLVRTGGDYGRKIRAAIFESFAMAGLTDEQAGRGYVSFASLLLGGMAIAEPSGKTGDDPLVSREAVERSLDLGIELLLFGVACASDPAALAHFQRLSGTALDPKPR